MSINNRFKNGVDAHWTQVATGGGYIKQNRNSLRLGYVSAKKGAYTDAQIDDYTMLSRKDYLWKPPLRMTVKARLSHNSTNKPKDIKQLNGTAGFGFWNRPFTMQGNWFTMPESVWFFYASNHSNMKLSRHSAGHGWKAQVVHGSKISSLLQAPFLAVLIAHRKITGKKTRLSEILLEKFSGTSEKIVKSDMTQWHTYRIDWLKDGVSFFIDDKKVFQSPLSPTKPLGFVAWIDNAYAIATPDGDISFGRVESKEQWLDLDFIKIEPMEENES